MLNSVFEKKELSIGTVVDNIFDENNGNYIYCDGSVCENADDYKEFFDKMKEKGYGEYSYEKVSFETILGFSPDGVQYPIYVNGYYIMLAYKRAGGEFYLAYSETMDVSRAWRVVKICTGSDIYNKFGMTYLRYLAPIKSVIQFNQTSISYTNNRWILAFNAKEGDYGEASDRVSHNVVILSSEYLDKNWILQSIISNSSSYYHLVNPCNIEYYDGYYYTIASYQYFDGNNTTSKRYDNYIIASSDLISWQELEKIEGSSKANKIKITEDGIIMGSIGNTYASSALFVYEIKNKKIYINNGSGGVVIDKNNKVFYRLAQSAIKDKMSYYGIECIRFSDGVFTRKICPLHQTFSSYTFYFLNESLDMVKNFLEFDKYVYTSNDMMRFEKIYQSTESDYTPLYIDKNFYCYYNSNSYSVKEMLLLKHVENSTPPLNKWVLAR